MQTLNLEQVLRTAFSSILLPLILGGGCLTSQTGCAMIEPHTSIGVNPITRTISFYDSKDNDILVENLTFDPDSNGFRLAKLTVSNKSTPVIEANVQQMMAFVAQQQAANEGIRMTLAGLAQVAESLGVATANIARALPAATVRGSGAGFTGELDLRPNSTNDSTPAHPTGGDPQ